MWALCMGCMGEWGESKAVRIVCMGKKGVRGKSRGWRGVYDGRWRVAGPCAWAGEESWR